VNIIFLDIEGVLNNHTHTLKQVKDNGGTYNEEMQFDFCPTSLENLRQIVEATDANIVISSTWRNSANVSYIHPLRRYWKAILINLGKVGIHRRVMDTTPWLQNNVTRGEEITAWLIQHDSDINFVIIDDDQDMGDLIGHLALCELNGAGITDEVRNKAIQILNKGVLSS